MLLAKVKGCATATTKHRSMNGQKLLICLQLDPKNRAVGDALLVVDQMGAGVGDTIMITSDGKGIAELLDDPNTPVRWFTLGIIDPGQKANPNAA
jgi:ethanolamine utilization protein EutN